MPFREKLRIPSNEKVLGAIESLKRVIGVPDQPGEPDSMNKYGVVTIHTPDEDSATLLNALFIQFVYGTKPAFEFDRDGKRKTLDVPRFVVDKRTPVTDCEVTAYLTPAKRRIFVERLEAFVGAFIAPSNKETFTDVGTTSPRCR